VQKHPDVTTKHGKLKSKRKNPPTTIYVDDLAALDSLSEVWYITIYYILYSIVFTTHFMSLLIRQTYTQFGKY